MGSTMEKVLALQVDLRASHFVGQVFRKIEWCWSSGEFAEIFFQLLLRVFVATKLFVGSLKIFQISHQSLRDELSTVPTVFPFNGIT